MMRRHPIRRRLAAVTSAVLAAGGCTADDATTEPEPTSVTAGYQQPPTDLCERMRVEEVLERQDLTVPPWRGSSRPYYDRAPDHWYVSCDVSGWSEDGRFAIESGEFIPSGFAKVWVYHTVEDAARWYEQHVRGVVDYRVAREPDAVTGEPIGWWDAGRSLTWPEVLGSEGSNAGEITRLITQLLVRHQNLMASVELAALSPTEQVEEVSALLHTLLTALLDESVAQVTFTPE